MLKFNENGRLMSTMIEGVADAAPAGSAVVPPAAGDPWFKGADAETVGYLQNRGLDKLTPAEAALKAVGFHREAEKFIGAPADKIVRLPNDVTDAEGWKNVFTKLGVPADAKGYDFSTIKHADGSALTPAEAEGWQTRALAAGLTPSRAADMVSEIIKTQDAGRTEQSAQAQQKLVEEHQKLEANWGPKDSAKYAANKSAAEAGATAMGVSKEAVAALEKTIGFAATMDMFRKISTMTGEDRFVQSQAPGAQAGVVQTRDQALERKSSLMADQTWVAGYLKGETDKVREMTALNTMIVGTK